MYCYQRLWNEMLALMGLLLGFNNPQINCDFTLNETYVCYNMGAVFDCAFCADLMNMLSKLVVSCK